MKSNHVAYLCALSLLTCAVTSCSQPNPKINSSEARLKMLGLGLAQYAQDHHNRLPPLTDTAHLKHALTYYIGPPIASCLIDPISGQPYGLNSALSGAEPDAIKPDNSRAVIFETAPGPDGKRGVVLLTGYHVRRLDDQQWQAVKPSAP